MTSQSSSTMSRPRKLRGSTSKCLMHASCRKKHFSHYMYLWRQHDAEFASYVKIKVKRAKY